MKSSNEDDAFCLERVGGVKMGIWEKGERLSKIGKVKY